MEREGARKRGAREGGSEVENGRERGTRATKRDGEREREGKSRSGAEGREGYRARAREKAIDAHPLTRRASLLPSRERRATPARAVASWRRMQISMAPRRPPARPSPTRFATVYTYVYTHTRTYARTHARTHVRV